MKQIPVSELIPGMVTAENVLTYEHELIIPKGVILTENIILRLESYSIYYVSVIDEIVEELSKPITPLQDIDDSLADISNKERIRNSEQFQRFCHDFNRCAEHFQGNLMKSLYHNQPFFANEIVAETMQIMRQDESDISVFDMLLNMKNIDDSVYNHCIDVALISNVLARWLHFSEEDQQMATACGLFHDVGKFLLPGNILRKPGKLTPEEFSIIKTHTI